MKRKYDELETVEKQKTDELENLRKKVADLQENGVERSLISEDDLAIVTMEVTEGVTHGLKEALIANDSAANVQGRKIRNELQMLSKKVDVKFTNLTTGQDSGPAGKKGYVIPRVPTMADLEGLRTSWEADLEKVKKEMIEEMKNQKQEILDNLRKFAQHGVGTGCGICQELGHKGRDCPKFDKLKWCRACGDDYHITANCTKDRKKCGKCGEKDKHCTELHSIQDIDKRFTLVREFGTPFQHFMQPEEAKNTKGGGGDDRRTDIKDKGGRFGYRNGRN